MASENAKAVAKDVIEKVKNKERIVMGKIVEKRGYAKSTIKHPKRVTSTKSYQNEIAPLVVRLKNEIDKIQTEMESRSLTKERYKELSEVQDKKIKNYQLLSGGATERGILIIPSEIKQKNDANNSSSSTIKNSE